jgi:hypothetical protein
LGLLGQWKAILASRQYVGGEFQLEELGICCRGPLAAIEIAGDSLRLRAEWLAGRTHDGWVYVSPPFGHDWAFPLDETKLPEGLAMSVNVDTNGQVEFSVPHMGSYTLLPVDAPNKLAPERVQGYRGKHSR